MKKTAVHNPLIFTDTFSYNRWNYNFSISALITFTFSEWDYNKTIGLFASIQIKFFVWNGCFLVSSKFNRDEAWLFANIVTVQSQAFNMQLTIRMCMGSYLFTWNPISEKGSYHSSRHSILFNFLVYFNWTIEYKWNILSGEMCNNSPYW